MTEQERARRIGELRVNLLLWDTPGFDRVIKDLAEYTGENIPIKANVLVLKTLYRKELQELEDNIDKRYKQGTLL